MMGVQFAQLGCQLLYCTVSLFQLFLVSDAFKVGVFAPSME